MVWTPPVSVAGAWAKLRRAREHFDVVRSKVEPVDRGDTYRIILDIDPDTGEYVFRVRDLEPLDPDWGLIIGDCLHNARSTLDHLMVSLFALATAQEPASIERIQFPICSEPGGFTRATGKLRKHPGFSGYLTRIEELQTFNLDNPSIWGRNQFGLPMQSGVSSALEKLSRLDNMDKHRIVHPVWLGHAVVGHERIDFPEEFSIEHEESSGEVLENDAEIGRWRFATPLPYEWYPSEVEVKRHFRLEVSLSELPLFKGVLEVLPFCLWGTACVLRLFDPVFRSNEPPLSVTATLAWDRDFSIVP